MEASLQSNGCPTRTMAGTTTSSGLQSLGAWLLISGRDALQ
eukprot:CAMPEP_0180443598 /NCGR_PEP_ID=MMETSP1036_2-20121128/14760_1 /TAXON_ID=632150 /ORGANISM="Azadinium spinosum, Strain 3D9" /LENGTH=40 /DNA_ID= /DNA_START= /DNA_END= /DNA_ORIENTATION=